MRDVPVKPEAMTRRAISLLSAVVLIASNVMSASAHRVRDCEAEVFTTVNELGVQRRSVGDIEIWHQDAAGGEGGRQGYLAYVSIESCEGYLMISTATSCQVLQVYTKGRCKLPGIPHFN